MFDLDSLRGQKHHNDGMIVCLLDVEIVAKMLFQFLKQDLTV